MGTMIKLFYLISFNLSFCHIMSVQVYSQIDNYERMLLELKDNCQTKENEITKMSELQEELKKLNVSLSYDCEMKKNEIEDQSILKKEMEKLQAIQLNFVHQCEEKDDQIKKLSSVGNELIECQKINSNLMLDCKVKEEKIEQLMSLEMENEKQKREILLLQSNSDVKDELMAELLTLRKKIEEYEETIFNMKNINDMKEEKLLTMSDMTKEIDNYKHLILDLNNDAISKDKQILKLEEKINDSQNTITNFLYECEQKDQEIADLSKLKKEIENYQATIADLKYNCEIKDSKLQEEKNHLEDQNSKLKQAVLDFESKCKTKDEEISQISNLNYDCELKNKQITILNDKVQIQNDIISSLQEQISLKNSGVMTALDDVNELLFLKNDKSHYDDKISQTDFGYDVSDMMIQDKNEELESEMSVLQDLVDFKLFISEHIDHEIEKSFMSEKVLENTNTLSYKEQVKNELNTLKRRIEGICFFSKNRTELCNHFTSCLEDKMQEVFSLKRQLLDVELVAKEKESSFLQIDSELSNLGQTASHYIMLLKSMISEFGICSNNWVEILNLKSSLTDVNKVQIIFSILDNVIKEKDCIIQNIVSFGSKEKKYNDKQKYVTKGTQTYVDNDQFEKLQLSVKEFENISNKAKCEIQDLNSKLQASSKDKESLQQLLESQMSLFSEKTNKLIAQQEEEKQALISKSKNCVQRVEERYNQEIIDLENKFFSDLKTQIDKLQSENRKKESQKETEFNTNIEKLKMIHEENVTALQEEKQKCITDLQHKLNAETNDKYSMKQKLEDNLRKVTKEARIYEDKYTLLKSKFKKYIDNISQKQHSEKSMKVMSTQTDDVSVSEPFSKRHMCEICELNLTKISDMKVSLEKLTYEVDSKKAKILSLEENNKNMTKEMIKAMIKEIVILKKDLNTKTAILRLCSCKQLPSVADNIDKKKVDPDVLHPSDKFKHSRSRTACASSQTEDFTKLDHVQNTAKETKVECRELQNGGTGVVNEMKCFYLERKITKKDKEIEQLKRELAGMKCGKIKKQPIIKNENILEQDFTEPVCNTTSIGIEHPFPDGTVPHPPIKGILHERNKVSSSTSSRPVSVKDTNGILVRNRLNEPEMGAVKFSTAKPTSNSVFNDKPRSVKEQVAFLSGEPTVQDCKQQ